MDNKKKELMDIYKKIFTDEVAVSALMEAKTVDEVRNFMEGMEVPFTQKDCEFLMIVKDKNFVQSLSEMKNNEEVQAVLEEKGFTLSLDECAMFRIMANKSIMESLAKVKSTEEIRNILEENGITLTPEAYSNLEWDLEVDVELTENELSNVAGGSWAALAAISSGGVGCCSLLIFSLGAMGIVAMSATGIGIVAAAAVVGICAMAGFLVLDRSIES